MSLRSGGRPSLFQKTVRFGRGACGGRGANRLRHAEAPPAGARPVDSRAAPATADPRAKSRRPARTSRHSSLAIACSACCGCASLARMRIMSACRKTATSRQCRKACRSRRPSSARVRSMRRDAWRNSTSKPAISSSSTERPAPSAPQQCNLPKPGAREAGEFRAVIDRHHPLEAIADAYRYVELGQNRHRRYRRDIGLAVRGPNTQRIGNKRPCIACIALLLR